MTQQVLMIGSGGIGGLYGALLNKAGWHVSYVARSDAAALRQGLTIESPLGDLSFIPHAVYDSVHEASAAGSAQWVVLTVKMLDHLDLAELIRPVVGPETKIVLLANGLDIEVPLAAAFPNHSLISGVAFVASSRIRAAHIHHKAYGQVVLGDYSQGAVASASVLAEAFQQAGIRAHLSQNIALERWKKSIWNASFNPLSVVTNGADTGVLLGSADAEAYVRSLMAEVIAAGRAQGFELSDDLIESNITNTKNMPAYQTSMALDYLQGRGIELEAILGNVVRAALAKNVSVPGLNGLYQILTMRR